MTEVVAPERRHVVNLTRHVRVGPAKVELLTHGRLPSPFTARDMYPNEWTGLTEPCSRASLTGVLPEEERNLPGAACL